MGHGGGKGNLGFQYQRERVVVKYPTQHVNGVKGIFMRSKRLAISPQASSASSTGRENECSSDLKLYNLNTVQVSANS